MNYEELADTLNEIRKRYDTERDRLFYEQRKEEEEAIATFREEDE